MCNLCAYSLKYSIRNIRGGSKRVLLFALHVVVNCVLGESERNDSMTTVMIKCVAQHTSFTVASAPGIGAETPDCNFPVAMS